MKLTIYNGHPSLLPDCQSQILVPGVIALITFTGNRSLPCWLVNYNYIMGHRPTYSHVDCRFIGHWARGIHLWGQILYWSILTGALVANYYIMGHLSTFLHVLCRFISNLARGINFWGQNKYSSILTGALVAGSYIISHLPTYLHVICPFIGNLAREIHFRGQI